MKELKRPTKLEIKIAEARSSGLSFCEKNELERRVTIDQIMFRGAAICGCTLPQTEIFAKFIAEEIENFILNFGYEEFTESEILLAMQVNAFDKIKNPMGEDLEQVVFSGISFNVVYLAKILKNYKIIRENLDKKIKNQLDGY